MDFHVKHLPRLPAKGEAIFPAMKPSLSLTLIACALLGLVRSASAADPRPPAAPPTDVIIFDHLKVDQTFATSGALHVNSLYKILAARRVAPGTVEIHERDTDVFYIVDGSATFVTGGTAVDPKPIGPHELHATSIVGGTEHHLSKGDVIIIPHGIPHQFTAVDGAFLYFVVKVTQ